MEAVEGTGAEASVAGEWSLRICFSRRFWASVEPYCADITSEEVRTLEELLKPPEDEAEHYKVETLGLDRHDGQQEAQSCLRIKDPKAVYCLLPLPCLLSAPLPHPDSQALPLGFLPFTPSKWSPCSKAPT